MARPEWRDRGKERYWKQVVRRWQRSGLGVRAFCAAEAVSEPSFYAWRRELARRDQQAAADVAPRFVPIQVRSDIDVAPTVTNVAATSPTIDVVLANGRRLCVPAGFDPAMLRQLLAVVEETPAC